VFRPPRKDDIEIQFNKELRAYFKKVHEFIGLSKKHIIAVIGQCVDHCFRYTSSQFDLCTKETYDQLIQCFKIDQMEGFLNFETLQAMNPSYTFNFDDRVKSTKQAKNNDFNRQMYSDKTNQKYKEHISKEYENYPRNTLYFDCERGQHPTQKPVALFEYLIRTYSNENEVILDNCSGSGTTAIACMNTNRRFICIERDETYHRKSIERIANHEPLFHLGDK
jgi:site-specific DNA-methyltransferase (adenine-specific)